MAARAAARTRRAEGPEPRGHPQVSLARAAQRAERSAMTPVGIAMARAARVAALPMARPAMATGAVVRVGLAVQMPATQASPTTAPAEPEVQVAPAAQVGAPAPALLMGPVEPLAQLAAAA